MFKKNYFVIETKMQYLIHQNNLTNRFNWKLKQNYL